jgi:maleylacetate reductase
MAELADSFTYASHTQRVVFASGSLRAVETEAELLGSKQALVVCTREQSELGVKIADLLGKRAVGVHDQAVTHVPSDVAHKAARVAKEVRADCFVAVGGGSAVGLAKVAALNTGLPILAIPTTYAGSEMTPIYGLTDGGEKKTGKDWSILPKTVIYDPDLTHSLPVGAAVVSALNAMAHAAEALYAVDANPISDLMAEEAIRALSRAMPHLGSIDREKQRGARSHALYGAWLAGTVLGQVGMGLHHKLCHTLGGSFNLPHAETHAVILPHALAYNAPAAQGAMRRIAAALNARSAPDGIGRLARAVGAPLSLRDIGMEERNLDRACDLVMRGQYPNPRALERTAIRELIQNAYDGVLVEATNGETETWLLDV